VPVNDNRAISVQQNHPAPDHLRDGYFGDLISSVDDPALSPVDDGLRVYPNPVTASLTISLDLSSAGAYSIGIVNQLGQLVQRSAVVELPAGQNITEMDVQYLPKGMYLVTINDAKGSIIARRMIVKN
jgi:hypothetical protein